MSNISLIDIANEGFDDYFILGFWDDPTTKKISIAFIAILIVAFIYYHYISSSKSKVVDPLTKQVIS